MYLDNIAKPVCLLHFAADPQFSRPPIYLCAIHKFRVVSLGLGLACSLYNSCEHGAARKYGYIVCGFPSRRRQCYIYWHCHCRSLQCFGGRTTAYADVIFSVLSESLSLSVSVSDSESDDVGQMNLKRGGYATNSGNVGHLK